MSIVGFLLTEKSPLHFGGGNIISVKSCAFAYASINTVYQLRDKGSFVVPTDYSHIFR